MKFLPPTPMIVLPWKNLLLPSKSEIPIRTFRMQGTRQPDQRTLSVFVPLQMQITILKCQVKNKELPDLPLRLNIYGKSG